jgi:hypothetical protein
VVVPSVVVSKCVGPRRIVDLLDLANEVVHIVHFGRIRIDLAGQPVQRVIIVVDGVPIPVGLTGQIVVRVVRVTFAMRRSRGGRPGPGRW